MVSIHQPPPPPTFQRAADYQGMVPVTSGFPSQRASNEAGVDSVLPSANHIPEGSLIIARGWSQSPVDSPHKGPVMRLGLMVSIHQHMAFQRPADCQGRVSVTSGFPSQRASNEAGVDGVHPSLHHIPEGSWLPGDGPSHQWIPLTKGQ